MKASRWFYILSLLFMLALMSACASDNGRHTPTIDDYEDGSRAHPAAYLTDSFAVHREPASKGKGPKVPFYFKRCDAAGERYFYSRTSYDCEYP